MIDNKFLSCIVIAAGSGSRMDSEINKPYIDLGGRKVLEITLDTVCSIEEIDELILVIRRGDEDLLEEFLTKYDKKIRVIYGSSTRELSTFEGLKALDPRTKLLITHDGVRPFATRELFYKVIDGLRSNKAVVSAVKTKDTVKIVDENMYVDFTPNRDFVYSIQTPQGFDKDLLYSMYEDYINSEFKVTDDSGLFEFYKRKEGVKVLEGEYSNFKLTTKEDIIFARAYIEGKENV